MNEKPCSHCGHCPTCGRGGYYVSPWPYSPWQPYYPYPWWGTVAPFDTNQTTHVPWKWTTTYTSDATTSIPITGDTVGGVSNNISIGGN